MTKGPTMTNPYAILGVATEHSFREIKAAYKKLLLKHNPVTGGKVEAYDEINAAYMAISEEKGWSGALPPQQRYRRQTRSNDVIIHLNVSMEDMFTGTTRTISSPTSLICVTCSICRCRPLCDTCNTCTKCQGAGVVHGSTPHVVTISPGIAEGKCISLGGYIDQYKHQAASNLVIQVNGILHDRFTRKGMNLYTRVHITLLQALTTPILQIERLDGTVLYYKWAKPLTRLDQVHRIDGEGMRYKNKAGKLYVSYVVHLPNDPIKNIHDVLPADDELQVPDDATVVDLSTHNQI